MGNDMICEESVRSSDLIDMLEHIPWKYGRSTYQNTTFDRRHSGHGKFGFFLFNLVFIPPEALIHPWLTMMSSERDRIPEGVEKFVLVHSAPGVGSPSLAPLVSSEGTESIL